MGISKKNVIFLPSVESHLENFIPVINFLKSKKTDFRLYLLKIDDIVAPSRQFSIDNSLIKSLVYHKTKSKKRKGRILKFTLIYSIINWIKKVINDFENGGILVVGNDAGLVKKHLIRFFQMNGYDVILAQDGWLISENIKKPIPIYYSRLKQLFLKLANMKYSPFRYFTNGFLGEMADYFFVYSKKAEEEFIKAGIDRNKTRITGSPRHHIQKRKFTSGRVDQHTHILIFSSLSFTTEHKRMIHKAISWIVDFYRGEREVRIKIHPQEKLSEYSMHKEDHVTISKEGELDKLIQNSALVFVFYSTVIIDVILSGKSFIQLSPSGLDKQIPGYHYEFPIIQSKKELYKFLANFDYRAFQDSNVFEYIIKDSNEEWNSIEKFCSELRLILQDQF